ncbi:hypothetical protein TREMEDRAFT_58788 [Tremella mesenterica DSM 1558]|uniref:uncharacterized protein n=1 Tax=Tremella mesenterica (strain ATCC 24925 / CBS 8224 / DSM 1558 / NBRC 9311 / NRRL Y-6157 / RJB 2259-6 / UBC 559-6) TaxID=578456 RepID=UPI0003F49C35|nr:uncharacterized protein TREMEDRAFT_58788 [Tremella mesenterica DSM 1558]EIW72618.1 hypothetical protein TREMEDRAFT_58788 [Tremella mesenterica DSM 1558]
MPNTRGSYTRREILALPVGTVVSVEMMWYDRQATTVVTTQNQNTGDFQSNVETNLQSGQLIDCGELTCTDCATIFESIGTAIAEGMTQIKEGFTYEGWGWAWTELNDQGEKKLKMTFKPNTIPSQYQAITQNTVYPQDPGSGYWDGQEEQANQSKR